MKKARFSENQIVAALKRQEVGTSQPTIFHVPDGYITGVCALQNLGRIVAFSHVTVAESQKDDFRSGKDLSPKIWRTND